MTKVAKDDEEAFLAKLPADGTAVTNKSVRETLCWDDEKYLAVRGALKARNQVVLGVGRGGKVMRAGMSPAGAELAAEVLGRDVGEEQRERDLYKGFGERVETWAKYEELSENRFLQITASQGRKATGGQWTRPDLVLLSVAHYLYVPGKVLDIVTFEVKTRSNWNITSVFEAAAHSRFATKSYLAIEQAADAEKDPDLDRIEEECARFGIGLIYFSLEDDSNSKFDVYLDPRRNQPDPADVDRFVTDQISDANRNKLAKWLR